MRMDDAQAAYTWQSDAEVLRSGATWNRGAGRVFYFQPGHEEFPTYSENKNVQKVITNAVKWLKPTRGPVPVSRGEVDALEALPDALFPERLERVKGKISKQALLLFIAVISAHL